MGRGALTRGGLAAALIALAIYVLLGGEIDLNGSDSGSSTATTPTTVEAPPADTGTEPPPTEAESDRQGPDQGADGISPQEADEIGRVLALVQAGGPFPHDQDGTTFQNREGLLPEQPEGYYKEYTCETPGSDDRGARRLVIGAGGETYYTADHYRSFTEIDPKDYT
jgi:ribonuclease T1